MVALVTVIIPAYNASGSIGRLVKLSRRFAGQVIVVDDASLDGTAALAERAGATVIRHRKNIGKAGAIRSALRLVKVKGSVVVFMDADFQHLPKDIPRLVKPVRDGVADVCIGSRFLGSPFKKRAFQRCWTQTSWAPQNAGVGDRNKMPLLRFISNRLSTALVSLLTGYKITDALCGFRAARAEIFRKFSLDAEGYSFEIKSLLEAKRRGLRVIEVPIETIYGAETSYIKPLDAVFDTLKVVIKHYTGVHRHEA